MELNGLAEETIRNKIINDLKLELRENDETFILNDLSNLYEEEDLFSFCSSKRIKINGEVDRYLNYNSIKEDFIDDPLNFWIKNKQLFPKLSSLAIKLLTIPASSMLEEQLFSVAAITLSDRRISLDKEVFNNLLFIKNNRDLLDDNIVSNNLLL